MTAVMKTEKLLVSFDSSSDVARGLQARHETFSFVSEAVSHLQQNHIIALPSDTLYGLFTPFFTGDLLRLHEFKGRSLDHPFLVLLPENYDLSRLVDLHALSAGAKAKIDELWPGRFSFVVKKNPSLSYPPGDTIGLRTPKFEDNPFFYRVLEAFGEPLAGPSLNLHGQKPLDDPRQMERDFPEAERIFFDRSFEPSSASEIWNLTSEPFEKLR